MCKIKNVEINNADKFYINKPQWGYDGYKNEVFAQIAYDGEGFTVKFTIGEGNPRRTKTKHFEFVHLDSCVEFFANFDPENSDKYINFETNANGAMNVGFRSDRYNTVPLTEKEVESFCITLAIKENYWTVEYKIGFSFIKKYYPDFDINSCKYIKGNLYKCGEETEINHFLAYFDVNCPTPDFHRPEFFGKIEVF